MSWIDKILPSIGKVDVENKGRSISEGLWKKCPRCEAVLYRVSLDENLDVCPKCDHHLRTTARRRLDMFLDENSGVEIGSDLKPIDVLKFKDLKKYKDRLSAATKATGENDALIAMHGKLKGKPVVAVAFEFAFIGGSMGAVVGEKFILAVNKCLADDLALICFATSGGARIQEALLVPSDG